MNTPIYDAMRKANRQRNKEALFYFTYGRGPWTPTPMDYEYPFTDIYPPDTMLLKDMLSPSSYESLKSLARRNNELWKSAPIIGYVKEPNESWHYTAPAFDSRF